jgi:bacillithiol biosynthesis cysteine-adding enzyme BshC
LVAELELQHAVYYEKYPLLKSQIDSLKNENTFTVTTGHQLCVAGGPLYYIFKIISTIRLADELNKKFPDKHVVPVYWMATEDHDFDEVKTIHLYNRDITWNQTVKGPTGKIPTDSIVGFLEELKSVIGLDHEAQKLMQVLEEAYLFHGDLAAATRHFVMHLFAKYGLVVLDANSAVLKKQFSFILKDDLVSQSAFSLLKKSDDRLSAHYKLQINARPINVFYLDDQLRERIVQAPEGHYEIVNTDLGFRSTFILDLLAQQPERFSPNVVLRPLYQESILPNLAYIGGPGELSYWMQLKPVFDHYKIFYPMLVPRHHALFLSRKDVQKFESLGFSENDLFEDVEELVKRYVRGLSDVNTSLETERQLLHELYNRIIQQMAILDPTLQNSAQAELQKAMNGIENLEKKMQAAAKRSNENAINVIRGVHAKVYPAKMLQERYANFIPYYLRMGEDFIPTLMDAFVPFNKMLSVIVEGD